MALSEKQAEFCRQYVIDLNATQAAIRAGYSAKVANKNGPRMLVNAGIQAEIERLQAERAKRTEVTADRVIRELSRLAFSDPRSLYRPDGTLKPPCEWDDDTAAAVASVETDEERTTGLTGQTSTVVTTTKVKRHDKRGPLELLGKHLGLFKDKLELTGKDGGPIELTAEQRADAVAGILAGAAKRLKGGGGETNDTTGGETS